MAINPLKDPADIEIARLESDNARLRHELSVTNHLLDERDRILEALPCPAHGPCVPYVLEMIAIWKTIPDSQKSK